MIRVSCKQRYPGRPSTAPVVSGVGVSKVGGPPRLITESFSLAGHFGSWKGPGIVLGDVVEGVILAGFWVGAQKALGDSFRSLLYEVPSWTA
jgi:hypothetical protein